MNTKQHQNYIDGKKASVASHLRPKHWLQLLNRSARLNGSKSSGTPEAQTDRVGKAKSVPAEIIGRTGYPLYDR